MARWVRNTSRCSARPSPLSDPRAPKEGTRYQSIGVLDAAAHNESVADQCDFGSKIYTRTA